MADENNFFRLIMEAETELPSFDGVGGTPDTPADAGAQAPPPTSGAPTDGGFEEPPPLNESNDADLGSFDDGGNNFAGDEGEEGTSEEDGSMEAGNKDNDSMTEKANNLLNQRLYEKLCVRNKDIESVLDSLQKLTPALSHEFIKLNEKNITRLKSALQKGKDYAINQFVDSTFGENQLFYNEIDALYSLICDEIDKNLKKNFKK